MKQKFTLSLAPSLIGLVVSGAVAMPAFAADPAVDAAKASMKAEPTQAAPSKPVAATPADEAFAKSMEAFLTRDENVEKVGTALERYFNKKRDEQAQQAAKAEEQQLEDQFKNPIKVDIGSSPVRGDANAKVTVVEFSDFQCPFCQRGAKTMEDLLKEYPKDVKVVFKNLPLPFHPQARPAAKAALAAGEQGKFWEMHDMLFQNQSNLTDEGFIEFAKKIGLDVEKFKTDMKKPEYDKQIDADTAVGQQLGVQGTPGFFVNGVLVRGARPLPFFKTIVDRWLKEAPKA